MSPQTETNEQTTAENKSDWLVKHQSDNSNLAFKSEHSINPDIAARAERSLAVIELQEGGSRLEPKIAQESKGLVLRVQPVAGGDDKFKVGMVDPDNQVNLQKIADALDVSWRKLDVSKISEEDFLSGYSTAYGVIFRAEGAEDDEVLKDDQANWSELVEFKTDSHEVEGESFRATQQQQHAPSLGEAKARTEKEFAEQILREALRQNASDVHFDMGPEMGMVRMRIDGVLYSKFRTAHGEFDFSEIKNSTLLKVCGSIASIAKVNYNDMLNKPQDSTLVLKYRNPQKELKETRIRFASIPRKIESGDQRGVKMTLRINQKMITNIDALGLEYEVKQIISRGLQYIGGIGLIVGGVGSGKSNILASCHTILRRGYSKNVMEYSDTIEQMFEGMCQTEVDANCTEDDVIKAYLRHDIDAVIASEVRDDAATKQLVKIATAGKLVLSTLHASSLPEVFVRLKQLGVPRQSQSEALRFVVFTSLVRRLCPKCKQKGFRLRGFKDEVYEYVANEKGCPHCRFVGYRGRTSVTEALCISPDVAEWIADENITGTEICRRAEAAGWIFPLSGAIGRKIEQGITSKAEILRVIDVERRNSQGKKETEKKENNWRDQPTKKPSDGEENDYSGENNNTSQQARSTPVPEEEKDYIDVQEMDDGSFGRDFEVKLELNEEEVNEIIDEIGKNDSSGGEITAHFDNNYSPSNEVNLNEANKL